MTSDTLRSIPLRSASGDHTMEANYYEISAADVPEGACWSVPGRNQGQIVEVAYSTGRTRAHEADYGDQYRRVTDMSDRSVRYESTHVGASIIHGIKLRRMDEAMREFAACGGLLDADQNAQISVAGRLWLRTRLKMQLQGINNGGLLVTPAEAA